MKQTLRVLIAEDNPADAELTVRELSRAGYDLAWERVDTEEAYLAQLSPELDVIISDFDMPQFDGTRALELLKASRLEIPFILISGTIGEEVAVAAMKQGAVDYLLKDRLVRLGPAVSHALEISRLRRERITAAEALRKEQAFLAVLIENVAEGIVACDADGVITLFNRATREFHGMPGEAVVAEDWATRFALFLPDGETPMPKEQIPLYRALHDGFVRDAEMVIAPEGKAARRVLCSGQAFFDASGVKTGAVIAMRDVTEQLKAEEASRIQADMLDQIGQSVIATDINDKVIYANRAAGLLYGWRNLVEMRGTSILELTVPPESRAQADEIMTQLTRGKGFSGEFLCQRRDGSTFDAFCTTAPLFDKAGERVGSIGTSTDITERKKIEAQLQESEKRYQLAIRGSSAGLWDCDLRTGVCYYDARFREFLGHDEVEFEATIEHFLENIVHPDDAEALTVAVNRHLTERGPYDVEYRGRLKSGAYRWFNSRGQALWDEHGVAYRMAGSIVDIHERKEAEAARDRLVVLLETTTDFVSICDHLGQLCYLNSAGRSALGISLTEEIRACSIRDFVDDPATHPTLTIGFPAAAKLGSWSGEVMLQSRDGRKIPVSQVIVSHKASSGEVESYSTIIRDVTKAKQIDERIREQAALLDLAHDAILVRDMDNRVQFWNDGAQTLYGWSASEVIGRVASTFLYDEEASIFDEAKTTLLEHGHWEAECKHLRKNGATVVVRSRWTLVRDEDGRPKAILVINTDITEQKKIEEQFLRAQRLESIGTLASGVAHDLNNILAPILMSAPLLHDDLTPAIREQIITTIEQSAERGAQIVKQVLTFARGVEGERVLIDPSHLLKEMAQIAEQTFPKSIRVTAHYPEDLWLVEGDPTQMHQILLNLSVNARDSMPGGGTLLLSAENFQVDEHYASMTPDAKAGLYVVLTASDTGCGMPREILDKMFDPFFTTKGVGKGTGLGLSTLLGIVQSHAGFLSVYSEPGNGTTFKVFLPASPGTAPRVATREPEPAGHGETVLVVDDEPGIVAVTKLILETHNYRVFTAEDGPEAIALFAQQIGSIDVVITDLMMPFMDGAAIVRALQRMKPGVRVIASTGQGEQSRSAELQEIGVNAWLLKPYDSRSLLKRLREVLAGEAPNARRLP